MKLIKLYLIFLLFAYAFVLGYMLVVGYFEGVQIVRDGLFLLSVGAVFGLLGYRMANRGKAKQRHYFD